MTDNIHISDSLNKTRRFFGRRKSKPLSPYQQGLYDKAQEDIFFDVTEIQNIQDLFIQKHNKIILEIGFGAGEHLIHQAELNKDINYIGIDPYVNSVSKAVRTIYQKNLTNIRLSDQDALGFLKILPSNIIDGIYLLYPDPWPKKRYRNRRFIQRDTASLIEKILKPDGFFRFASDIPIYIEWVIATLMNATTAYCDLNQDINKPLENWVSTRYEQKALREGRDPHYFQFFFKKNLL